jgi:hypothetical protein
LVKDYGVVTFDMCTQDLTDPYRGVPLKKRTGVLTNSDALRTHLKELRCTCTEKHGIVAGSTWQQVDGVWRATSLATFAGGYTAQFAKTLLTKTCEDLVALTCPVMTFADQRRYHDHMETVPFAKKQKLATEEVSATTAQGGKAAASVARKKKVVRVISKFLRLARSSPLLDHLKRTAERQKWPRLPQKWPRWFSKSRSGSRGTPDRRCHRLRSRLPRGPAGDPAEVGIRGL